jgi:hypothetical protein
VKRKLVQIKKAVKAHNRLRRLKQDASSYETYFLCDSGKLRSPVFTVTTPETYLAVVDATKHSVTIKVQFMKP